MSRILERYQNPTVGDNIRLRLFSYNSNNLADINIEKIEVFFCDPAEVTDINPEGRRLIETFDGSEVVNEDIGANILEFKLESTRYAIGRFIDVWTFRIGDEKVTTEQIFEIYPQLWYATPIPVVYDFAFHFQPNKLRRGSKQFIIIEIVPNVPRASDLKRFYENLAIVSDLKVSIEQSCGPCVPDESDLRLIVEDASVDYREKRFGYYQLDTSEDGLDLDCGIYNIWFKLEFGGNIYISDKNQFQVF